MSRSSEPGLLRRIAAGARPYRRCACLGAAIITVSAALGVVPSLAIQSIFDYALPRGMTRELVVGAAVMIFAPVCGHALSVWGNVILTRVAQRIVHDLRLRVYHHAQKLSLSFHTGAHSGDTYSRLTNDINGIQGVLGNAVPSSIAHVIAVASAMMAMLYISPFLTFLSIGVLPVFVFISYRVAKVRRAVVAERQRRMSVLSQHIVDTLSPGGVLLHKIFGREDCARKRLAQFSKSVSDLEIRQQAAGRMGLFFSGSIVATIPAIVILVGGLQLIHGTAMMGTAMSPGKLIAFVMLQIRFFLPAVNLFNTQAEIQGAIAMFERIVEFLSVRVEIPERSHPLSIPRAHIRGQVSFQGVAFGYPSPDRLSAGGRGAGVIDLTFEVQPGEMLAIVGPSGSGKTTIGHLLQRFYDVDKGSVCIDGIDVRDLALSALRSMIGIVGQDTHLLHGTVKENLLFGRPDASEDEMVRTALAVGIDERIMSLERGYDTTVGEGGRKFSGGERQRIAIARALLKAPKILILDEATSALDSRSERLVQAAVEHLMAERTTIVIAHRLSTVLKASNILVMDQGRIVGQGRHSTLLAECAVYARLYALQSSQPNGARQGGDQTQSERFRRAAATTAP